MSISNKDADNKLRQLINQIRISTKELEKYLSIDKNNTMILCNHDSKKSDIFFKIKNGLSELFRAEYSHLYVDPHKEMLSFRIDKLISIIDSSTIIYLDIPIVQNKKYVFFKKFRKSPRLPLSNKRKDHLLRFLKNDIGLDKEEIYNLTEKILFRIY